MKRGVVRGLVGAGVLALAGVLWQCWPRPPASKVAVRRAEPASPRRLGASRRVPSFDIAREPGTEEGPARSKTPSLPLTLCTRDPEDRPVPGLVLTVYCSGSSAMLPGATGRTDETGCLQTRSCPGQDIVSCVRVAGAGLRLDQAWVVEPGVSSSSASLGLTPGLEGQVQDRRGAPLAGVRMWIETEDPDPMAVPLFAQGLVVSDAQGRFSWTAAVAAPCDPCVRDPEACELARIPVGAGPEPGIIWSRHPDYGLTATRLPSRWGSVPAIELAPDPGEIRGTLAGERVKGAVVMLRDPSHRQDRQRLQVGADGSFAFGGLGAGPYVMTVFVGGRQVARRENLRPGDRVELSLTADPPSP